MTSQEYNDVKVANEAFRAEIAELHAEREELLKAVRSLGRAPDVEPIPEVGRQVLRALGLSSQSEPGVKDEVKNRVWGLLNLSPCG